MHELSMKFVQIMSWAISQMRCTICVGLENTLKKDATHRIDKR